MKDYPLEKGFEQFGKFVEDYLNDDLDKNEKHEQIYKRDIVLPSEEVLARRDLIAPQPVVRKLTSNRVRAMVRIKRGLSRRSKELLRKIFRV